MRPRGIAIASLLFAAACSAANPPAAGESTKRITNEEPSSSSSSSSSGVDPDEQDEAGGAPTPTTDASRDASANVDAYVPPPPSECNPELTIGAATMASGLPEGARFAGITRDELTIAWTSANAEGKTSLFVAERDHTDMGFSAAQTVSLDAASDGVAISDDGLTLYAVAADHRSFIVYTRDDHDSDFAIGDDSMFDNVIQALEPEEQLGDPVFVNSGVVFLYSVYGKSADTVRLAGRISIHAAFYPTDTLEFAELRASGGARRRPTGTGDDFQVLFYWDEITQSEKIARLYGTEYVMSVRDLGARPWAQVNGSCSRIYFGAGNIASAPTY